MKTFNCVIVCFILIGANQQMSGQDKYINDPSTLRKTGDISPLMSIRTIEGHEIDFHGRVVVLNFFATWCGPCKTEMPHLEHELWRPLLNTDFILISVGIKHSHEQVQSYQRSNNCTFLFAADQDESIYHKFATTYIPRCIVIGRDGRIKYQTVGFYPQNFKTLINIVRNELEK